MEAAVGHPDLGAEVAVAAGGHGGPDVVAVVVVVEPEVGLDHSEDVHSFRVPARLHRHVQGDVADFAVVVHDADL